MLSIRFATRTAVAGLVFALAAGPISADAADSGLALKRVMLSTGGVGYFEYEARVSGDADLSLTVPRDRVDDVMKSLVVYDDRGGVGTVSLPGRTPMVETFRELPFGAEALTSPEALLTALRGAEVRLSGDRALTGRVVSVTEETRELPEHQGSVLRHRLSLMTAEGLRQAILEDVDAVRFADPKLQAQIETALGALAEHGERDRRVLTLHTTAGAGSGAGGSGERTVRVAYVVAAPLWKTTYRLTLDGADAAKGGLQGWAVLENLSGEDWNGVDLTVVSGNPVTFRQALYDAYYVSRPEVPVEVLGRVLPKVDEGTVALPTPRPVMTGMAPGGAPMAAMASGGAAKSEGAAPRMATRALRLDNHTTAMPMAPPPALAPPQPTPEMAEITAAESTEATTQVTFHHPGPVTVASGHSLLLPIVNRDLPAQAIALYQPATQPRHPLAAVRLTNDGASGLPPGILTLYQRGADGTVSYIGDAQLAALPAGQDRLLSFAVDQKVTIDRTDRPGQSLSKARLAEGVFELVTTDRATTRYTIAGAPHEARRVVIEHPRIPGWELVPGAAGAGPVETTADAYRLSVEVPAGKTVTVEVTTEQPRQDRFEVMELSNDQVGFYANAKELPAELRKAMVQIIDLRAAVDKQDQVVSRLEQDQEDITKDQDRVRQNFQAVGSGSDLGRRYMSKLSEEEDRLERLAKTLITARAARDSAQQTLADTVKGLKF